MNNVFISHSHSDKLIARTMARYLRAYGINPWLDERELRFGDQLDDALQQHIRASSIVAVLATSASASSKWVELELDFARKSNPSIPVCPIFLESLQTHHLFSDFLGLDATNPHEFSLVVERFAEALLGSPLPQPATDIIADDLKTLGAYDRRLGMLVEACLSYAGPYFEHQATIAEASFFELDYTLNALSYIIDTPRRHTTACSTAELFAITGAGSCALGRYFKSEKDRSGIALIAFNKKLRSEELPVAINFLSEFDPPDDFVLSEFIDKNAVQLQRNYKRDIVRMITWPPRGPEILVIAGASGLKLWPENKDLMQLWDRWIWQGLFDGPKGSGKALPYDLVFAVTKGLEEGGSEWVEIFELMISHIRGLVRSASVEKVQCAYQYFREVGEQKCSRGIDRVMEELGAARWSAEWEDWDGKEKWIARITFVINAVRKGSSVFDAIFAAERDLLEGGTS